MARLYVARWRFSGDVITNGTSIVATVNKLRRYERGRGVGRISAYIVDDKGVVVWEQEA